MSLEHFDSLSHTFLANIVMKSGGRLLEKYLDVGECETHHKERAQAPKYVIRWLEEWFLSLCGF